MPAGAQETTLEVRPDQRICLLSDLHLGDGSPVESFGRKDGPLRQFLRAEASRADAVVIAGDGFDLAQAWTFERIRAAHREVVGDLVALARERPVYYLLGNHDPGLERRDDLPLRFAGTVRIGPRVRVEHGHRLDWRNQPGDRAAFWGARAHAQLERVIRSPVRVPMRKHYHWSTRLGHWIFYRYGLYLRARARLHRRAGQGAAAERCERVLDYWGGAEWGDNHHLLEAAEAALAEEAIDTLICGHSHQAGVVRFAGGTYVNTGSWTYGDTTYAVYDRGHLEVRDWSSGRAIGDEEYRGRLGPHRAKSFFDWWQAFYRGRLRYDVAAMNALFAAPPPPRRGAAHRHGGAHRPSGAHRRPGRPLAARTGYGAGFRALAAERHRRSAIVRIRFRFPVPCC